MAMGMVTGTPEQRPAQSAARGSSRAKRQLQQGLTPVPPGEPPPVGPGGPGGSGQANPPPGQRGGGGAPPAAVASRQAAQQLVGDCSGRVEDLRQQWGLVLQSQVTRNFNWVERVLADNWEPRDIIRDSVAHWVNSYGAIRDLYQATYRFYSTPKKG
jgi:hypothetical protein